MISKKNVCTLILGAIFVKSKHIQRFWRGFQTFCPNFYRFSPNQKIWGCSCTPVYYTCTHTISTHDPPWMVHSSGGRDPQATLEQNGVRSTPRYGSRANCLCKQTQQRSQRFSSCGY